MVVLEVLLKLPVLAKVLLQHDVPESRASLAPARPKVVVVLEVLVKHPVLGKVLVLRLQRGCLGYVRWSPRQVSQTQHCRRPHSHIVR